MVYFFLLLLFLFLFGLRVSRVLRDFQLMEERLVVMTCVTGLSLLRTSSLFIMLAAIFSSSCLLGSTHTK